VLKAKVIKVLLNEAADRVILYSPHE